MSLETLSESEIIVTFLAIALLLLSAWSFGTLFEKIKAPRVVGEIIGGMFWGGSFLYFFFPNLVSGIFMAYPQEGKVLNIFYQLGLVFLMFLSGYNTRLEVDKPNAKTIGLVFVGATIIPMALAIPFIPMFRENFIGEIHNELSFGIVFAIGVAITSIPVISKIFFDMGIMNTKFSNTVLTVSTFQDLCLWVLLNMATRMASTGEINLLDMLLVVVMTLGLFVIAKFFSSHMRESTREIKAINFLSVSFIVLLLVCAGFYKLGINIMYSSFLVGYVVKSIAGGSGQTRERMQHLNDFAFSFFVPVYFALVGIQLNVIHDFSPLRFIVFFAIAFGLEAVGTLLMVQFSDLNRATKLNFAITMNARGGPGIVLATVAYSYQIINVEFFTVLILTTMLSSLIAGYWLRMQQKKDENMFTILTKQGDK